MAKKKALEAKVTWVGFMDADEYFFSHEFKLLFLFIFIIYFYFYYLFLFLFFYFYFILFVHRLIENIQIIFFS